MKHDGLMPKGFVMLDDVTVYTNGTDLFISGLPMSEEDAGELAHNCDFMGCGWEHIIAKGAIETWDCFDWRMKELKVALKAEEHEALNLPTNG